MIIFSSHQFLYIDPMVVRVEVDRLWGLLQKCR